ncbi:MAG: alpha/beta hydrolase [Alistipes sp.]|nr:alpha/beta hydrolase [Alistipes sp.]
MRRLLTILIATVTLATASAQKRVVLSLEQSGADQIVENFWDNTTAPHSNGITADETINHKCELFNTVQTDFYLYKADPAVATGQAVLVVPGGGLRKVCIEYDGFAFAQYLRSIGISALVLKYRLPNGHKEVPMEDMEAALNYLRTEGQAWGVDPQQVGIAGSSAGGYLAAYASTLIPDERKPAFSILVYSVISGVTRSTHHGTFGNMLGRDRCHAEQEYYSLENRVTNTTPPTLLLLADDDLTVSSISSTRYYKALKRHGVKAAMHLFPSGGHGWSGHDDYHYAEPSKRAIKDWLEILHTDNNPKTEK